MVTYYKVLETASGTTSVIWRVIRTCIVVFLCTVLINIVVYASDRPWS